MTQKRVVSWAAVSSLPQAKKISLEDQLKTNREHAARFDGQIVAELVVPGESRSIVLFEDAARKIAAYADLHRLIQAKAFDVLVYLDRSRLGRKAALSMAVVDLCHEAGIVCYETDNPPADLERRPGGDDEMLGALKSVWAAQEVVKIQARHDSGMVGRVRAGKMPGALNYGYRVRYHQQPGTVQLEEVYEVAEHEAAVVRLVFDLYLAGRGCPAIADELNRRGIPPPRGDRWADRKPLTIIENAYRYAGYVEWNRKSKRGREYMRYRGSWPALIDDATLARVQAEQAARRYNRRLPDTAHRLSSVAYCVRCGGPMYTCVGKSGAGKPYISLRCQRHTPSTGLAESKAYAYIEAAIKALVERQVDIEQLLGETVDRSTEVAAAVQAQENIIAKATADRRRIDTAYTDGLMDADGYRYQVQRLKQRIAAANDEIARLGDVLAEQGQQEQRRARIEEAIAAGLQQLNDPDPTRANIWLRTHIRLWVDNQQVISIEWL